MTQWDGAVYAVYGGVEMTALGTPTVAAVVVTKEPPASAPILVGIYPYPAAGSHMLVPESYSGTVFALSNGTGGIVQFNLATLSFEQ